MFFFPMGFCEIKHKGKFSMFSMFSLQVISANQGQYSNSTYRNGNPTLHFSYNSKRALKYGKISGHNMTNEISTNYHGF